MTADAIRYATGADVALNCAGMVRAGLTKGTSGVQTAYDIFLLAPLGIGVADQSAGGSLVVAYLTGREIKNCLEFLLAGNPNLPGQYFPRVSGMRFRYDSSRPQYDAVTAIELGDLARGYRAIDISDTSKDTLRRRLQPLSGARAGRDPQEDQRRAGRRAEEEGRLRRSGRARTRCRRSSPGPYLLPPKGTIDKDHVVRDPKAAPPRRSRNGRRS